MRREGYRLGTGGGSSPFPDGSTGTVGRAWDPFSPCEGEHQKGRGITSAQGGKVAVRPWQTMVSLCVLSLILLVAGLAVSAEAASTTSLASIASASFSMPTYAGPGGVRVPVGTCTVVRNTRVLILPCSSPQVTVQPQKTRVHPQAEVWGFGRRRALMASVSGLLLVALVLALPCRRMFRGPNERVDQGSDGSVQRPGNTGR